MRTVHRGAYPLQQLVDMNTTVIHIRLSRLDFATKWGFRLAGGRDYLTPLTIRRVTHASLAERAGLQPGDMVLRIDGIDVGHYDHQQAVMEIVRCANELEFLVYRSVSNVTSPLLQSRQRANSTASTTPIVANSSIGLIVSGSSLNLSQSFVNKADVERRQLLVATKCYVCAGKACQYWSRRHFFPLSN